VDLRRSQIDFASVECLDGEHAGTKVMMEVRTTRTHLPSVLNCCRKGHA
jgi:hypothetical protein